MKNILLAALILSIGILSCGKSDSSGGGGTTTDSYMSLTAGQTRTYEVYDSSNGVNSYSTYNLTSTSRDSAIGSRSYHVFTNSGSGGSEYYNVSGNDYYTFQQLPSALGGTSVDQLYLKTGAAVGQTWTGTINITSPIAVTLSVLYKVKETGLTKTVNGISYSNVIHVESVISAPFPFTTALTSDIQTYYAPKYGLILNSSLININYLGITNNVNTDTKLKAVNF